KSLLASLIPASGDQDDTTSPSALRAARLATKARPSHPAPTFAAIGQTPLSSGIRTRRYKHIFLKNGSEIFDHQAEKPHQIERPAEIGASMLAPPGSG